MKNVLLKSFLIAILLMTLISACGKTSDVDVKEIVEQVSPGARIVSTKKTTTDTLITLNEDGTMNAQFGVGGGNDPVEHKVWCVTYKTSADEIKDLVIVKSSFAADENEFVVTDASFILELYGCTTD